MLATAKAWSLFLHAEVYLALSLSNSAFKFNLRGYMKVPRRARQHAHLGGMGRRYGAVIEQEGGGGGGGQVPNRILQAGAAGAAAGGWQLHGACRSGLADNAHFIIGCYFPQDMGVQNSVASGICQALPTGPPPTAGQCDPCAAGSYAPTEVGTGG